MVARNATHGSVGWSEVADAGALTAALWAVMPMTARSEGLTRYRCAMKWRTGDERVFVVAPGPVVLFFPKVRRLLADLLRMESQEREAARFYSVDGEVLTLVGTPGTGFHFGMTGEFDRDGLRAALASVANDPTAVTEPSAVAAELASQRRSLRWFGRNGH